MFKPDNVPCRVDWGAISVQIKKALQLNSVAILFSLIILQNTIFAQADTAARAHAIEHISRILVPNSLAPLKFGDPVYMPIAIRNTSDRDIEATQFDGALGLVPITIELEADANTHKLHLYFVAVANSPGADAVLPKNSVSSSVIQIPLWTPDAGRAMFQRKRMTLTISRVLSHADKSGFNYATERIGKCELSIEGSAFSKEGTESMLKVANQLIDDEASKESFLHNPTPVDFQFSFLPGQSPLSWLDPKQRNNLIGDTADFSDIEGVQKKLNQGRVHDCRARKSFISDATVTSIAQSFARRERP